jgi:hypothetical protein
VDASATLTAPTILPRRPTAERPKGQSPGPPAPQDLKHSDFNFSHSIIVSFFFASHSALFNSHPALFECLVSLHSLSFREQSKSLPGQAIFRQLRQGSPQPAGNNPIKANVTMTFKTRKRVVVTIGFPELYPLKYLNRDGCRASFKMVDWLMF